MFNSSWDLSDFLDDWKNWNLQNSAPSLEYGGEGGQNQYTIMNV